jgi:hypothetical protein
MSEKNINKVFLSKKKDDSTEQKDESEKKKKRAILVLDIACTLWTFWVLSIYKGKTGKEKNLLLYCLVTLAIYYIARLTGIINLMNIFHVLLALGMVLVSLVSEDKDILMLLINSSLLITASRRIFNGCIVRDIEKKDSEITNNGFTKMLKWDYIFPSLGLIGLYKLNRII